MNDQPEVNVLKPEEVKVEEDPESTPEKDYRSSSAWEATDNPLVGIIRKNRSCRNSVIG